MGYMKEKVAYLKGLAEGMNIGGEGQGKLLNAMISTMDEMADAIDENEAAMAEIDECLDDIYDELDNIDDYLSDDEDEDEDEEDIQAIAAMAYGTESVPKVYKIFGPGNQYVTAAKQLVSLKEVAIDMPAGPSEVEVLADETANPVFVAADLLSQAEHGVDSQAMLVTTSEKLMEEVEYEVQRQLALLSRWEIAEKSLANSKLILVKDMDEAIALTNEYAPEHLIIETRDYEEQADGQ